MTMVSNSVSGLVFFDLNGDGSQESTDAGYAGLTVSLLNSQGSTVATTVTGSSGAYSFTSVAPGTYTVAVTPPTGDNFSPVGSSSTYPNSVVGSNGHSSSFSVGSANITGLNAGVYSPVSVTGTVFNDANDDGLYDTTDTGLAGVTVQLLNGQDVATGATTTTNSSGYYSFTGLAPGSYAVKVINPALTQFSPLGSNTPPQATGALTAQTNLLTNGSFEQTSGSGQIGFPGWVESANTVSTPYGSGPGDGVEWSVTNGSTNYSTAGVINGSVQSDNYTAVVSADNANPNYAGGSGTHAAYFVDDGAIETLSQTVTLTAGQVYEIGFDALETTPGASNSGYFQLSASINGTTITVAGSTTGTILTPGVWTHFADLYTAPTTGPFTLTFTYLSGVPGSTLTSKDVLVDDVYIVTPQESSNLTPTSEVNSSGITPVVTLTSGQTVGNESAGINPLPATLSGVQFIDSNADGVQENGEAGAAGDTVNLTLNGTVVATTTTNASGAYSFTGLAAGAYTVSIATPSGYTVSPAGSSQTLPDSNVGSGGTKSVTLTAGESTTINAGVYKTVAVSGVVFTDLNADGSLESGESGLAGQTVKLENGSGTVLSTTTTNSSGAYSFTGLTPNSYALAVTGASGDVFSPVGTSGSLPNSVVGNTGVSSTVAVSSGQTQTFDAGEYAKGAVSGVVFGDTNADGAQQGGETGLAGQTVELESSGGAVLASSTTSASGAYSFTGLTPASYTVQVVGAAGDLFSQVGTSGTLPNSTVGSSGAASVTVSSGQTQTVNAGEYAQGAVSGVVFADTNADGAKQAGEPGLGSQIVSLYSAGGTLVATTTTNASGAYSFTGVSPASYTVQVTAASGDGFSPAGTSGTLPDSTVGNTGAQSVTVASGQTQTVNAGEYATTGISGVVFNDANADGAQQAADAGLAGQTVKLETSGGTVLSTTTTGVDGYYTFTGLTPATYTLQVVGASGDSFSPGGTSGSLPDSVVGSTGADSVTLSSGQTKTVDAGEYAPATLNGVVFGDSNADGAKQSGESGLSGQTVKLENASAVVIATTTTSASGAYSFTGLTPASYTVQVVGASGDSFSPVGTSGTLPDSLVSSGGADSVTLSSGQTQTVNAGEYAPATVSGVVFTDTNADGAKQTTESGLAGQTVELVSGGAVLATATTNASGAYSFTGVTPGGYTIQVLGVSGDAFSPTGSSGSLPNSTVASTGAQAVTLTSGQAQTVNAGEYAPASVNGVVFNDGNADGAQQATDAGLAGQTVKLETSGGTVLSTTTTNASGAYSFTGLTPASYKVAVVAVPGDTFSPTGTSGTLPDSTVGSLGAQSFTLTSGLAQAVNAGEYAQGQVAGVVFADSNADGAQQAGDSGLVGQTVNLENAAGTSVIATTTTNSTGAYSFTNLTPTNYTVQVVGAAGDVFSPVGTSGTLPDSTVPSTGTQAVAVNSGQTTTVDAGEYAKASMSGVVFADTNADGAQQAGETGLAGQTVTLLNGSGVSTGVITTTNSSGAYSFTGLTPGSYEVGVTAASGDVFSPVGASGSLPNSLVNTAGDTSAATLTSGQSLTGQDAGEYAPTTINGVVFTDANADGAQQAGEAGLAGQTVQLENAAGTSVIATTTTNGAGAYSFTGVTPGGYTVQVTGAVGDVFSPTGTSGTLPDSTVSSTGAASVTTTSGQTQTVNAGEYAKASMSGVVFADTNADGAQQAGETGLAGQTVTLLNGSGVSTGVTTTTNSSGAYSFTGLTPGSYEVGVTAAPGEVFSPVGASGSLPNSLVNTAGDTSAATLTSGQSLTGQDAGEYAPTTINGVVFTDANADGAQQAGEAGLAGQTVKLETSGGTVLATTTTNASGAYSFTGVTPGGYTIQVTGAAGDVFSPTGTSGTLPDSTVSSTGAASVTTTSGQAQTVNAGEYAKAAISGVVFVDANADGAQQASDAGLSGQTVKLETTGGTVLSTTNTNASGDFSFTGVTPGSYQVQVVAAPGDLFSPAGTSGSLPDSTVSGAGLQSVTLTTGQTQAVNAGEYANGGVSGVVFTDQNADGAQEGGDAGLAGQTVKLETPGGTIVATTTTNASGAYSFTGVAPASYMVQVVPAAGDSFSPIGTSGTSPDSTVGSTGAASVTVASGQTQTVDAGEYANAALNGVVFSDSNADGAQQATETGLAGQTVKLETSGGTVLSTTTTNSSGAYSFTGVTPGGYIVQVVGAAGDTFSPTGTSGSLPDSTVGATGAQSVTLTSGQAQSVNAGEYTDASVSGVVFADANADGAKQASETGLAGQTVNLDAAGGAVLATTTTNSSGTYSFTGLTPGAYSVQVAAVAGDSFSPTGTSGTLPDSTVGGGGTQSITLASGQSQTVNAGEYLPTSIGGVVFADANADGAQQAGETGLAGQTVKLESAGGTVLATTTTNGAGAYSFTGVTPGGYTIQVTGAAGDVFSPTGTSGTLPDSTVSSTGAASVTTTSGQTQTVNAGEYAKASMSGVVFADTNADGSQEAGETGLAGQTVTLLNGSGVSTGVTTTTNSSGAYSFTGLTPGSYEVGVTAASGDVFSPVGASGSLPDSLVGSSGDTSAVTLTSGQSLTGQDAGEYAPTTINGVVFTDANADGAQQAGEPGLPGQTVQLESAGGTVLSTTTTNASGAYSFTGVRPGGYTIQVTGAAGDVFSPTGTSGTLPDSTVSSTGAASVTTTSGQTQTVNAGEYAKASMSGVVFTDNNANGVQDTLDAGLAGQIVTLLNGSGVSLGVSTTTGAGGAYSFTGLTPGSYEVAVTAAPGDVFSPVGTSGVLPDSVVSSVGDTSATALTSGEALAGQNAGEYAPAMVSGVVFTDANADGAQQPTEAGLAGQTVKLETSGGTVLATTTTNSSGAYSFTGVAPGSYSVQVTSAAGDVFSPVGTSGSLPDSTVSSAGAKAFTVTSGQTQTVDAGEYAKASMSGVVFTDNNADGVQNGVDAGLAGQTVTLLNGSGVSTGVTTTTNASGAYSFTGLTPGGYEVAVTPAAGDQFSPVGNSNSLPDSVVNGAGLGSVVTLTSGQSLTGQNAGEYAAVSLSGHAFTDNNADGVQNGADAGLAGVTVNLLAPGNIVAATTTTGAGGVYSFTGLAPGVYQAQVVSPAGDSLSPIGGGGAINSVDSVVNPGTGDSGAFTLTSGQSQANINAGIWGPGSLSGQVFLDNNANGVEDGADAGLGGVAVELLNGSGVTTGVNTDTSANGTYSFTGLTPGQYEVKIIAPPGDSVSPVGGPTNAVDSIANPATGVTPAVAVASSANTGNQNAGLYVPAVLTGSVFVDNNADGVEDFSDSGLAGQTVSLLSGAGVSTGLTTTTNASGVYSFTGLTPGSYEVSVTAAAGDRFSPLGTSSSQPDSAVNAAGVSSAVTLTSGQTGSLNAGEYVPATVDGVVFADANADGAQQATETGLGGQTVKLESPGGTVLATTTTNASGAYSFTGVTPGGYAVQVVGAAGDLFSPVGTSGSLPDSGVGASGAASVTVASGQTQAVNAGEYANAAIDGVVFADANADGAQQATDAGLAGQTVELETVGGTVLATTTTNASGAFSLTGVTPGGYKVQVIGAPGDVFSPAGTSSVLTDSDVSASGGATVAVISGQTQTVNAGEYALATIVGVVFDDNNADGAQQAGDTGLAGQTVELIGPGGTILASTSTNASGAYSLTGVVPGVYTVQVLGDPGDRFSPAGSSPTLPDSAVNSAGAVSVTTTSGATQTVNAGEYAPASLSGVVFADQNADGAQQLAEPGLGGQTVQLLGPGQTVVATTTTGPNGAYSFTGITPGAYSVQVAPSAGDLFSPVGTSGVLPDSSVNGAGSAPVTFTAGQAQTVNAGEYADTTVSGVVFTDQNADGVQEAGDGGLGGQTVKLETSGGTVLATTTTNANGAYSFTGVAPGGYTVQVTGAPGDLFSPVGASNALPDSTVSGAGAAAITVTSGQPQTVNAGEYGLAHLSGVVFTDNNADGAQEPGDAGLAGQTVNLVGANNAVVATTTTNAAGAYSLTGLTPGAYTVQVVGAAGDSFSPVGVSGVLPDSTVSHAGLDPVTLASAGSAVVNAGEYAPATISGTVFADANADGVQQPTDAGLGNETVNLLGPGGSVVATTTTSASGGYSFTGLTPGGYTVQVVAPAGALFSPAGASATLPDSGVNSLGDAAVTVTSGQTQTVNAGQYQLGAVAGLVFADNNADGVKDGADAGLAGQTVTLLSGSGASTGLTTTTNASGAYSFTGLAPGSYEVSVTGAAGDRFSPVGTSGSLPDSVVNAAGVSGVLTVASGLTQTADAGEYAPVSVSGHTFADANADGVQEAGEAGLAGVTVNLLDSGDAVVATTTSGAGGAYSFTGLAPGAYQVQMAPPAGDSLSPIGGGGAINGVDSVVNPATDLSSAITLSSGQSQGNINAGLWGPGSLSGLVFLDNNADGVADGADAGLGGIVVELLNAAGVTTGDNVNTDATGRFTFTGLMPGQYEIKVIAPTGDGVSPVGGPTNAVDSIVSPATGIGPAVAVASGANTPDQNAGLFIKAAINGVVFADANADGVQEAGDAGLAGQTVELLGAGGAVAATTTTNASGGYSFTGLTPGAYSVQVVAGAGESLSPVGTSTTLPDSDVNASGAAGVTLVSGQTATVNAGEFIPATVTGTVFTDQNADGVQQAGDAGLGGVRVDLIGAGGTVIATTTTLANGTYSFTGVTPGVDMVQVIAPTGDQISPVGTSTTLLDSTVASSGSASVTLTSGSAGVVNAGLFAPATIGGYAFFDANGDGVQEAGEPDLGGVTVNLLNASGQPTGLTAVTAADGTYSFQVTPGSYEVQFVAPSGDLFSPVGADSVVNPSTGITPVVTLTSGQSDLNLDAGIQGSGKVSGLVFFDGEATGTYHAGDPGVAGVLVRLLDAAGNPTGQTTLTNGQGEYSFSGLSAGTYEVQVVAPAGMSYSPQEHASGNPLLDSDVSPATGTSGPLTIASGQTNPDGNAGLVFNGDFNGANPIQIGSGQTYVANSGSGVIVGTGNDLVHTGPGGNNVVVLGDGENLVEAGSGPTTDIVESAGGLNAQTQNAVDGFLFGGVGPSTLQGGQGDTYLMGGVGQNMVAGGNGANVLIGGIGGGAVTISGGVIQSYTLGSEVRPAGSSNQILYQKGDGVELIDGSFNPSQDTLDIYGYSGGTMETLANGQLGLYLGGNDLIVFNGGSPFQPGSGSSFSGVDFFASLTTAPTTAITFGADGLPQIGPASSSVTAAPLPVITAITLGGVSSVVGANSAYYNLSMNGAVLAQEVVTVAGDQTITQYLNAAGVQFAATISTALSGETITQDFDGAWNQKDAAITFDLGDGSSLVQYADANWDHTGSVRTTVQGNQTITQDFDGSGHQLSATVTTTGAGYWEVQDFNGAWQQTSATSVTDLSNGVVMTQNFNANWGQSSASLTTNLGGGEIETQYFDANWQQTSATIVQHPSADVTITQTFNAVWDQLSADIVTVSGSTTTDRAYDGAWNPTGGTVTTQLTPHEDLVQSYDANWDPIAGQQQAYDYVQAGLQVLSEVDSLPTIFVVQPGDLNGDAFSGFVTAAMNPTAHDVIDFEGYGPTAALTQIDASHWQISAQGHPAEVFTLAGSLSAAAGDVKFT